MRTIHSRTYTNVALTMLIILLLAVLARPYVGLPKANAASGDSERQRTNMLADPNAELAAATREVANSNKEIAVAIRETAKAQQEVARSISGLANAGK